MTGVSAVTCSKLDPELRDAHHATKLSAFGPRRHVPARADCTALRAASK